MTIRIDSTTDTPEAVQAAIGGKAEGDRASKTNASAQEEESSQSKPSESDPESQEEEGKEKEDSETEKESASEDDDPENSEDDQPKRKNGFKKRIAKLNARISDRERELEYWKSEAIKAKGGKIETPEDPSVKAPKDGRPVPDDFETNEEYVEALTDWKTEQKIREHERNQEISRIKAEQERQFRDHLSRVETFKEKVDDFEEALENVSDVPVSSTLSELIVTSENGPELMYELAKDREEFERINKLPPLAAARALGRLESRISSSEKQKPEIKKTTKAPPPMTPVGSKVRASTKSPDQMSYREFKAWREAQSR